MRLKILVIPHALLLLASAFAVVPQASAVTIVTYFMGGTPPANAAGGGDLMAIVNSAARTWESAYSTPSRLILYVGWAEVGPAGIHALVEQGGAPNRETVGMILFDNSGALSYYLDPTPDSDEEYLQLMEQYQDLGGGHINVGRVYTHPTGDAEGRVDLLTAAMHEIGHALGMSNANLSFTEESRDGIIRISEQFPFAGTVIPLASNYSGLTSHFDAERLNYGPVMTGFASDERRLPSALDILAIAQISRFDIRRPAPLPTPVSSSSSSSGRGRGDSDCTSSRHRN